MNYIDALKEQLNNAFTENGDKAFSTSGSYCLDYYALIGGMRHNYSQIIPMFVKAFNEDRLIAIKLLFYTRDIRGGLGERNTFRMILNYLGNFYPEIAKQLIEYIPEYGRYDDLFVLLTTPVKQEIISYIKNQLAEDIQKKKNGKSISLLAKWMPSINTSSSETRALANRLCDYLEMSRKEYRKTLSFLREGLIIENNLREKEYTFLYENVPSVAAHKYIDAFIRNDKERYTEFIKKVNRGEVKINTAALYPYQVVKKCMDIRFEKNTDMIKSIKDSLDATWKSFDRNEFTENTIVVKDGSGSMTWAFGGTVMPLTIATSLAILFSEQLAEPFKNSFITFSTNPKLVTLEENDSIFDKVMYANRFNECSNTNISKVYNLILKIAVSNKVSKEDMIKKIIIISDMEFDACAEGMSTFESFKQKYELCGYDFPELVFWNVAARNVHLPVTMNEKNVKLVSGASDKIISMVMNGLSKTPYDFMMESLEKYKIFDNLEL